MELVREYLISNFIETNLLSRKNIEVIVDRKLRGDSDEVIAAEESARIRKEERIPIPQRYGVGVINVHHTAFARPILSTSEVARPIEWESDAFVKEEPLIDQIERLREKERLASKRYKVFNVFFLISALMIITMNVIHAIFDPAFPIGFIPLPFLVGSLIGRSKAHHRQERALSELNSIRIESPYSELFNS